MWLQPKSAWQAGCSACQHSFLQPPTSLPRCHSYIKATPFVLSGRYVTTHFRNQFQLFSWKSVFLECNGFQCVYSVPPTTLQSLKTCFPCSVCSLCTCGGQRNTLRLLDQTALCSCAHGCRPQYSLQTVRKRAKSIIKQIVA